MKDEIKDRLDRNLKRVENLLDIFEDYAQEKTKRVTDTDILRSATVFLHAALEDFLRSLAAWKLPLASEDALNNIPLVGGQSVKFSLGNIANYRDMSVGELIRLSVDSYLGHSNYNNTTEIANLLIAIDVNVQEVNSNFSKLDGLMDRRHQIVHRADRKDTGKVSGLRKRTVKDWLTAVEEFSLKVLDEIPD